MSLRSLWRRLWAVEPQPPNEKCPVCGAPVVVAELRYEYLRLNLPRPDAELRAACVEHGRSPYNDMTISYRESRTTS